MGYKGYIAHVPINTNTTADGRNSAPVEMYKALCIMVDNLPTSTGAGVLPSTVVLEAVERSWLIPRFKDLSIDEEDGRPIRPLQVLQMSFVLTTHKLFFLIIPYPLQELKFKMLGFINLFQMILKPWVWSNAITQGWPWLHNPSGSLDVFGEVRIPKHTPPNSNGWNLKMMVKLQVGNLRDWDSRDWIFQVNHVEFQGYIGV